MNELSITLHALAIIAALGLWLYGSMWLVDWVQQRRIDDGTVEGELPY